MALLLQITPPSSPFFFNSAKFKFNPNLKSNRNHILSLKPPKSLKSPSFATSISTLNSIQPYVQSQWQPILKAYLCSAVSAYSLSKIVPKMGTFSATMATLNPLRLRDEGLALGALFVVRVFASYLQQSFLWDAALSAVYWIRVDVFEKVLGRELGFWEGSDGALAGDVAYRITAEAVDVADTVYALLNTTIPSILQLSAMATQMMVISPVLSLVSALVIPLMALVIAYLGEKLRKISKKAHLSIANLSAYLNEVLPSILFVKANNAEYSECIRFQGLALTDLSTRLKKKKMKALVPQIVQIIYFGALFAICLGSLVVSSGSFNSTGVVSFITSLVLLIEPIQDVGKAYNEFKQGEPAIDRLFQLSRSKCQPLQEHHVVNVESIAGEVKFCDISFRYGNSMPLVLNGLNLHIEAGETVALVGASGGGKTTLMKLLLRLYEPLSGCILLDSHDIQDFSLECLRTHVGLVTQDITVFSGTVAENIGYRDLMSKIDMERVQQAAQTASADEFIRKLPEQYETNVGPRGSLLSGGQRQRLAIARALYQNPSILILDEATSALDSRSELLVRQALQRLTENRTVIVIAHRMETLLMADRIFLLNDGKLLELSHSSLLAGQHGSLSSRGLLI